MEAKREYRVGPAALALTVGALGSRGVGFLREVVVAARFGTGRAFDLYVAGSAFPTFLSADFLYALPDYLVPYLSRLKEHRRAALGRFLLAILVGGLAFLGFLYFSAPFWVQLFAPGLPTGEIPFGVRAFQILLLFIFGTAMEAVLRSYYQVEGRFGLTAFGPLLSGMVALASVFFLSGRLSVYALAWGWAVGSLLPAGIMLGFLLAGRKKTSTKTASASTAVSSAAFKNFSLIMLLSVLGQLVHLIDRFFGSFLPPASLAAFYYASLPVLFPVGILVYPLAYAVFPRLSLKLSEKREGEAGELLTKAFGWVNFVLIPLTAVFILFPREVTALVFQRGAFDSTSAELTAGCLRIFGFSLPAAGYLFILGRVYLAGGCGKRLALILLASLAVKFGLAFVGINGWGLLGLAGAASLTSVLSAGVHFAFLPGALGKRGAIQTARSVFKTAAAAGLAFGAATFSRFFLTGSGSRASVLLLLGAFFFFFLGGCWLLRLPELAESLKLAGRAFSKFKAMKWSFRSRTAL